MNKSDAEAANWQLAHHWADGLGLEFAGVDLADVTVYSLLQVIGKMALIHLQQVETVVSNDPA